MNTTNDTTSAAERTIKVSITDSSGHTELILGIKEAAIEAFKKVKEKGFWIFCSSKNGNDGGFEPIYVDGKEESEAIPYLAGIFEDAEDVLLTTNLVGGYYEDVDIDDVDDDEDVDDDIVGNVRLVYADDEDGKETVTKLSRYVPQLVVEIDLEGRPTIYVRNTKKAIKKIADAAPLISAALGKIVSDASGE